MTLLGLYAFWGASLVYWQILVRDFNDYCKSEFERGNYIIKDSDNFMSKRIPFWVMGMSSLQYGIDNWQQSDFPYSVSQGRQLAYIIMPDSIYGKPFDEWPKVPGNNDFRFAGPNTIVRKHDSKVSDDGFSTIYFGSTSLHTSPIDYVLGLAKGYNGDHAELTIGGYTIPIEYMGDSLEVVFYYEFPRTLNGRDIIAIER